MEEMITVWQVYTRLTSASDFFLFNQFGYIVHATCAISCAISCKHKNAVKIKNLYDSYSKEKYYKNSEYEVHQVGPKYFRSRNFSFLAFKGEAVGLIQISSYNSA
jgi:hypothetical protein